MPILVSGELDAPVANHSHTEPNPTITGAIAHSGQTLNIPVGNFGNTGNVAQTVTVAITNPVNCTIDNFDFLDSQLNHLGHAVTLNPTQNRMLSVNITPANLNPGDPNTTYSFTVEPTWS